MFMFFVCLCDKLGLLMFVYCFIFIYIFEIANRRKASLKTLSIKDKACLNSIILFVKAKIR